MYNLKKKLTSKLYIEQDLLINFVYMLTNYFIKKIK